MPSSASSRFSSSVRNSVAALRSELLSGCGSDSAGERYYCHEGRTALGVWIASVSVCTHTTLGLAVTNIQTIVSSTKFHLASLPGSSPAFVTG